MSKMGADLGRGETGDKPVPEYDEQGYDAEGYDADGFNADGIHCATGTKYDPDGDDVDGFNADGIHWATGTTFDRNRHDRRGFSADGIHRETVTGCSPDGYDRNGFNADGVHYETGTKYDSEGYDSMGFNADGIHWATGTGYDSDGYDRRGFNADGIHFETGTRYSPDGFSRDGHPERGNGTLFDSEYDEQGHDRNGFSARGIHRETGTERDLNGFGADGIHWATGNWYDPEGYNRYGLNADRIWRATGTTYSPDGWDFGGFNAEGIYWETGTRFNANGLDAYGFNADGIHSATGTAYDSHGYDRRGFNADGTHWVSAVRKHFGFSHDGINRKTRTRFNANGYDAYGFNAEGIHWMTGTNYGLFGYDLSGFNAEGVHWATGTAFDPDGYDVSGSDAEGVHWATGTAYEPDDDPVEPAPDSQDSRSVEVLGVSLPASPTLLCSSPNARPDAVGIIIDLDQTLVDTSAIEARREQSRGGSWGWVRDAASETVLMPSVKTSVEALCEFGQVCIATNAPRRYAEELVRHHRLGIPVAAAWQDTKEHKPRPAPLERAAHIMGVPVRRCIHIGDSADDARAALAIGMGCVIIKAGAEAATVMDVDDHRIAVAADWEGALKQVEGWRSDLAEAVRVVEVSPDDGALPHGGTAVALGEYHPYRQPHSDTRNPDFDAFSADVLSAKRGEMEALAKFFDVLDPLIPSNAAIACPPASDSVKSRNGIRRLAMRVANARDRVDATSLFIRTDVVQASSSGGGRSVAKHLESVSVSESTLESLQGRPLVILDDVVTTGSTLRACVQLLEPYGGIDVVCVALGRTVR